MKVRVDASKTAPTGRFVTEYVRVSPSGSIEPEPSMPRYLSRILKKWKLGIACIVGPMLSINCGEYGEIDHFLREGQSRTEIRENLPHRYEWDVDENEEIRVNKFLLCFTWPGRELRLLQDELEDGGYER